jgi:hypothetical protein
MPQNRNMERTPLRLMALGCAAFLSVWAILTWSVFQILPERNEPILRNVFAPLSAFFLTFAVLGTWGFARGSPWKMRPPVLGAKAPEDGQIVQAIGRVRPLGFPLRAPFSGTECVSYMYTISESASAEARRNGNEHARPVPRRHALLCRCRNWPDLAGPLLPGAGALTINLAPSRRAAGGTGAAESCRS